MSGLLPWSQGLLRAVAAAAAGADPGGRREGLLEYVACFLLISLVVAFVSSAIRVGDPRTIARETTRFFVTIVVGIFIFSALVFGLEWLFIRPLL